MGKLFRKGYEERRAEFVFSRFHQEDEFDWGRGDPSLEAWLETQAVAAQPDDCWHRLLDRPVFGEALSAGVAGDMFADFGQATSADTVAAIGARLQVGGAAHLLPLMVVGGLANLHLLWGPGEQESAAAIITIPSLRDGSRPAPAYLARTGGSLAIGTYAVSEQHYLRHLLFVWSSGETFAGFMKWRRAREEAVERVRVRLAASRARAERDFNAAVACSADGTKIVGGVQHVLVFEPTSDMCALSMLRLYPASAFQDANQILRVTGNRFVRVGMLPDFVPWLRERKVVPRVMHERAMRNSVTADDWLRFDPPGGGERLDECVWFRLPIAGSQRLMKQDGRGLLITPRKFCPDPLPTAEFEDLLPTG